MFGQIGSGIEVAVCSVEVIVFYGSDHEMKGMVGLPKLLHCFTASVLWSKQLFPAKMLQEWIMKLVIGL